MELLDAWMVEPFREMADYPAGLLETVIAGLGNGFLYALVAIGFVIVFKSSSVFNYAQGAMVFFAALNFAGMLGLGFHWLFAGLFSLLMMAAFAVVVERTVLRPLVGQEAIAFFMATIGVSFFLEGFAEAVWGGEPRLLKIGLPEGAIFTIDYEWGQALGLDIIIQESDLVAITAGLLVIAGLYAFFQFTALGRILRAVADDQQAALSIGAPLNQIWVVVWSLSGATAFVAAVVWGAKIQIEPSMLGLALKALPVLILGGFTSIPGAVVGGVLIGISELVFETYWGQPLLGGSTTEWFAYVLAVAFLLVRPQGLFGEKIIERV